MYWQFKFEVSENRKILKSIIDTIIFLGRQGLALRGHRDDSQYHLDVGEYSTESVGNLIELLNCRDRDGDKDSERHLESYSKNASYISKTTHELIQCNGKIIKKNPLQDTKKANIIKLKLMTYQICQIKNICCLLFSARVEG